jgi:hypothetical protein
LGYLLPVRSWHPRAPDPAGIPSTALAHRSDSVSDPLLGFNPPSRYVPKSPPEASRPAGTSPGGLMPLQRSGRREPTARQLPGRAPRFCRDSTNESHPAGYGAAHRFSQPRSGFFLPPPSCHFQTGGALGVSPYRGLFLPRSPDDSSPPACPHDVSPFGWPSPVLGGGASGRAERRLGFTTCAFGRLQGLCPRGSRSAPPGHG